MANWNYCDERKREYCFFFFERLIDWLRFVILSYIRVRTRVFDMSAKLFLFGCRLLANFENIQNDLQSTKKGGRQHISIFFLHENVLYCWSVRGSEKKGCFGFNNCLHWTILTFVWCTTRKLQWFLFIFFGSLQTICLEFSYLLSIYLFFQFHLNARLWLILICLQAYELMLQRQHNYLFKIAVFTMNVYDRERDSQDADSTRHSNRRYWQELMYSKWKAFRDQGFHVLL